MIQLRYANIELKKRINTNVILNEINRKIYIVLITQRDINAISQIHIQIKSPRLNSSDFQAELSRCT